MPHATSNHMAAGDEDAVVAPPASLGGDRGTRGPRHHWSLAMHAAGLCFKQDVWPKEVWRVFFEGEWSKEPLSCWSRSMWGWGVRLSAQGAGKAGEAEGGEMPLMLVIKDEYKGEAEETTLALNRISKWFWHISSCLWNRGLGSGGKGFANQGFAH